jgi:hypothetical protein
MGTEALPHDPPPCRDRKTNWENSHGREEESPEEEEHEEVR